MTVVIVWLAGQPDLALYLYHNSFPKGLYLAITSIALQNNTKGG
jgi:hypothetical protein